MKNHKNTFEENTIYVDETSMLDIELAHKLLDAVHTNTKLIFIGDTKQLPSVGPGNVFHDLIQSNVFNTVKLHQIMRQAKDSNIIKL